MKIPISHISIGERQRDAKDLEDLNDLESMGDPEIGQLQPIGVHTTSGGYELIWGRRRLAKAVSLGWDNIEAVTLGHIPPTLKQEMELVEDIGRKDRSWQDKCRAMFKLYKLKQREKKALGENWTIRMMAALTGDSKTNANRMLQVGEEITNYPDGEVAKAPVFWDAIKMVFKRNEKLLTAELEKRRQATLAQVNTSITEEEPVPNGDSTPAPDIVEVTLHVVPKSFHDAETFKDYQPETFHRALGYNVPLYGNIIEALKKDGLAVLWYDSFETFVNWHNMAFELGYHAMPWPLVWNKIRPGDSKWPWVANQVWGLVVRKGTQQWDKTAVSATMSVIETEPGKLHYHVADMSLAGSPENMPVLVLGESANPAAVVESGRTPVVFEPDKDKHDRVVASLREHYENTIPGVVFK